MVEMASAKFVCIVDETKLVKGLGGSGGECPTGLEKSHLHLGRTVFDALAYLCAAPTAPLITESNRIQLGPIWHVRVGHLLPIWQRYIGSSFQRWSAHCGQSASIPCPRDPVGYAWSYLSMQTRTLGPYLATISSSCR
jgi:hypothetical protein